MPTPLLRRISVAAALLLSSAFAQSAEILLYDGQQGNLPQNQPWMTYVTNPLLFPQPLQSATTGGVRVDTRSNFNHSAGYFNYDFFLGAFLGLHNPAFPNLNPADGFKLGFELQIHDEDHLTSNRAGFSDILLGMDLFGIELGFWENRVWAQSGPSFTQAEGTTGFDTTLGLISYELLILNTEYFLLADGFEILTGPTRNYSPASPFPDPYDEPNMLFFGDNTTSASADFTLGSIRLTTGPFTDAPTPAPLLLLLTGAAWLLRRPTRA